MSLKENDAYYEYQKELEEETKAKLEEAMNQGLITSEEFERLGKRIFI